ncbi:MAG: N-6 DNA methylase [Candidatus Obscuribacter sp.]|nr:N-6 DNA methylase [Candidatus Obscuribacter sp.]
MVRPLSKGPGYEIQLAALLHKLRRGYLSRHNKLSGERYAEQLERSLFDLALAFLGKPGQFSLDAEWQEVLVFAPLYVEGLKCSLAEQGTVAQERTLLAFYLSRLYETLRFGFEKRPAASYYTPPRLAYAMAAQLLKRPLKEGARPPIIYDPCLGTGCLLLPFLDLLGGSREFPERKLALSCLRGMEQDAHALALAQILMVFAVAEPACDHWVQACSFKQELTVLRRSRRFRRGDSLKERAIPDFDLLVANPPWQSLKGTKDLGAGNISRLFLERAAAPLLYQSEARRVALLLPASLLADKSAAAFRGKLLAANLLEQVCLYDNGDRGFPAHASLNYSLWVLSKKEDHDGIYVQGRGGTRHSLSSENLLALSGPFSIFLLPDHERELLLLLKLREALEFGRLLGEKGLFQLGREFDMTTDRACFLSAEKLSEGERAALLPLLEGRMVSRYGLSGRAFVTGWGRSARWQSLKQTAAGGATAGSVEGGALPLGTAAIKPQFYLKEEAACRFEGLNRLKLCFQSTGSSANRHLMVAAPVPDLPCGNSLSVLKASPSNAYPLTSLFCLLAILNSLVFEFQLGKRLLGNNLNQFLVGDCSLPRVFELFLAGQPQEERLSTLLLAATTESLEQGLNPCYLSALVDEGLLCLDELADWRRFKAGDPEGFAERMESTVASLYQLSSAELQIIKGSTPPEAVLGNG